jgi:hypothetical protein
MSDSDVIEQPAGKKLRGNYAVSPRLQRALAMLASGEAKTQAEACAAAGLTARALQLALKRPSVRDYMRTEILASLGLTATRAARLLAEVVEQSDNAMASYHASKFALAVGANVAPPPPPGVNVNILNAPGPVGYVVRIVRKGDGVDAGAQLRPPDVSPARGPLIEGEVVGRG